MINKYYEIVGPYGLLYADWYSLSYDGVFYEEDVAIQLESGYSPYKGPIIFGTNSYEGTLLYFDSFFSPDTLKPYDIREVFPAQARVQDRTPTERA